MFIPLNMVRVPQQTWNFYDMNCAREPWFSVFLLLFHIMYESHISICQGLPGTKFCPKGHFKVSSRPKSKDGPGATINWPRHRKSWDRGWNQKTWENKSIMYCIRGNILDRIRMNKASIQIMIFFCKQQTDQQTCCTYFHPLKTATDMKHTLFQLKPCIKHTLLTIKKNMRLVPRVEWF